MMLQLRYLCLSLVILLQCLPTNISAVDQQCYNVANQFRSKQLPVNLFSPNPIPGKRYITCKLSIHPSIALLFLLRYCIWPHINISTRPTNALVAIASPLTISFISTIKTIQYKRLDKIEFNLLILN